MLSVVHGGTELRSGTPRRASSESLDTFSYNPKSARGRTLKECEVTSQNIRPCTSVLKMEYLPVFFVFASPLLWPLCGCGSIPGGPGVEHSLRENQVSTWRSSVPDF